MHADVYTMTSSLRQVVISIITGFLIFTKRTESGPIHRHVAERDVDEEMPVDISCILINDNGRIATDQEARVCLPLNTTFNVSCTLLEEPDTVIDRHRRSVTGSLNTIESNQYIDSICQWENTQGNNLQCTLVFLGLSYSRPGEATISVTANYDNVLKRIYFEIFDPSIAHPECNPSSTTQTLDHFIISTTRMTSSRRVTTRIQQPPVGQNNADIHSMTDDVDTTTSLSWQIFIPVGVAIVLIVIIVIVVWRKRTNQNTPPAREEYEAVERELNENG
ncbi:uncharacterized protein [Apostichopus japonicus]|uniref:uncharacterized protein isoform X3 n=1 Tax=Stichopus japonicus TaxID=307972 RepID=UPI003AB5F509